ncbi:MAG: hypothetical protein ACEPOZ_03775 [Marinifilaceae bacterium]
MRFIVVIFFILFASSVEAQVRNKYIFSEEVTCWGTSWCYSKFDGDIIKSGSSGEYTNLCFKVDLKNGRGKVKVKGLKAGYTFDVISSERIEETIYQDQRVLLTEMIANRSYDKGQLYGVDLHGTSARLYLYISLENPGRAWLSVDTYARFNDKGCKIFLNFNTLNGVFDFRDFLKRK